MDFGGNWCPYWTTTWFCSGGILLWGPNGASLLAAETTSLLNNRWPLGLLAFSFLCLCTAFWSAETSQSIAYQRVWDSHKFFRLLLSVVCISISFFSSILAHHCFSTWGSLSKSISTTETSRFRFRKNPNLI